ncbi:MAG: hypothetical protein AAF412_07520 [Pseudomonadota bacterium]
MKTLALTLAASLIASTSAFAGLFDVNEAPAHYKSENAQVLDIESTASIGGVAKPADNDGLFDVNDRY